MASFISFCFATFFIVSFAPAAVAAEEFKVGGDEGWRQPPTNETEMYERWAAALRFHAGDSLRFKYNDDTVAVVNKWGYYHCNSSHAVSVFKDGNTVINLERPGPVYFVSANPAHCKNGQRLMVEVMTLHPIARAPPQDASPAPSPSSGAGSFLVAPEIAFWCVILVAASINM